MQQETASCIFQCTPLYASELTVERFDVMPDGQALLNLCKRLLVSLCKKLISSPMLVVPLLATPERSRYDLVEEDEQFNLLFSNFQLKEDKQEFTFFNELYICYGDTDATEVEWIPNPLFDATTPNFLMPNGEESVRKIVSQLKLIGKNMDIHDRCVQGRALVVSVVNLSQTHFTESDAVAFIQLHLLKHIMPVPYRFDLVETFDKEHNYRFIVNDHPRNYFDIINVQPPLDEKAKRDSRKRSPRVSRNLSLTDMNNSFVDGIVRQICLSPFIDYTNGTFDYKAFAESELFVDMTKCAATLRYLDINDIENKIPFFVNVYNMMAIQAQVVRGGGDTEESRTHFVNQDLYYIGQHKFSLKDIEHILLAQPHKIPEYKYAIRKYCIEKPDFRVIFALCDGSKGTPLPHALSSDNYNEDIANITSQFIEQDLLVDQKSLSFTLSDLYIRHRQLFPKTIFGLVSQLGKHTTEECNAKIWTVLNRSHQVINVQFRDRVYKSNRKPKIEIVQESTEEETVPTFLEVIDSDFYRPYLARYCRIEFSMENIMFYEALLQFKSIPNASDRKTKAMHLFNTFLAEDAELEINVTRSHVESIGNILLPNMKVRKPRASVFQLTAPKNYDSVVAINASPSNSISPPTSRSTSPMSISPSSMPEINISEESSQEVGIDFFSAIEKEIKVLLGDTFRRFENSETYKNMLEDKATKQMKPSLGVLFNGLGRTSSMLLTPTMKSPTRLKSFIHK
jgi:hypothetical protein